MFPAFTEIGTEMLKMVFRCIQSALAEKLPNRKPEHVSVNLNLLTSNVVFDVSKRKIVLLDQ